MTFEVRTNGFLLPHGTTRLSLANVSKTVIVIVSCLDNFTIISQWKNDQSQCFYSMKQNESSRVGNTVLHFVSGRREKIESHAVPGHGISSWLTKLESCNDSIYVMDTDLTKSCGCKKTTQGGRSESRKRAGPCRDDSFSIFITPC